MDLGVSRESARGAEVEWVAAALLAGPAWFAFGRAGLDEAARVDAAGGVWCVGRRHLTWLGDLSQGMGGVGAC